MTLKSHTEQVIKKYDESFGGVMDTECEHGINPAWQCPNRRCECRLFWASRDFLLTALKELSDLQAEETRVKKKKDEGPFCCDQTSAGGHNSAVEQQEKLSNAFRNL